MEFAPSISWGRIARTGRSFLNFIQNRKRLAATSLSVAISRYFSMAIGKLPLGLGRRMKTMADRKARRWVIVVGLLAVNCLVSAVEAKTIVVNSYDAAVLVEPGRHLIDHAVGGSHSGADVPPLKTSFDSAGPLSGLYNEGRRLALNELHARNSASAQDDASVKAPVQHDDFRAMLLVGAVLIAQQLRRKHRSLKQSLIPG